jgi:hypothetical protein
LCVVFFFNSLSPFTIWPIRYLAVDKLSTPTLSSPQLSFFLDDTKRTRTTSMGGHPAWDSNPASRFRKSVALPPTTLPSAPARHTHTSMARRRFEKILPLRWDSNPLAPGPRPRSTVSEMRPPSYLLCVVLKRVCIRNKQ